MAARKDRRYCSRSCKDKARHLRVKADPERYARLVERRHRNRTRKPDRRPKNRRRTHGAEAVTVDRLAILERDGWRCQVRKCLFRSRTIDPALAYPHPRSATLDHVVPHSLGGAYVPANLQAAHLRCNVVKGAGGTDQLRLIG
jgi:5-methylcytosine-specific restriction endonuclease McrA